MTSMLAVDIIRSLRMMIVYVDFHVLALRQTGKFSDTPFLPGVHQNQPFDRIDVDLFDFGDD